MKVKKQTSKILAMSSAAHWCVLACVAGWFFASSADLLQAEDKNPPASSLTNEMENVSTQPVAGDDVTRLPLTELKSKLAQLEQQAKENADAAKQKTEFIKKLREALQARLDQVDKKVADIASQNKKIILDWNQKRERVDRQKSLLEAGDEVTLKLRNRIADLEKELAQVRQELQEKLEAKPEMKEVMASQNAASDELKKLVLERQKLLAEKKDLAAKNNFLKEVEATSEKPLQPGGNTGNK